MHTNNDINGINVDMDLETASLIEYDYYNLTVILIGYDDNVVVKQANCYVHGLK